MQFLRGPDAEIKIRELLTDAKWVRIAVAYWGKGAVERLKLDGLKTSDVQVICDLRSGGCSPKEVEILQSTLGEQNVFTRDNLHAKVWLTDKGAVLGSSNASTNGFGVEGKESSGLEEANVFIGEKAVLTSLRNWFDVNVYTEARPLLPADFAVGKEKHKRAKGSRITLPQQTFLDALRENPGLWEAKKILVWSWIQEDLDDEERAITKSEEEARGKDIDAWFLTPDFAAPLTAGTIVIEFNFNKRGRARLDGVYRVVAEKPHVPQASGLTLVVCEPVTRVGGLRLGDQKIWEEAATQAAKSAEGNDWDGHATKFAMEFLQPLANARKN